LYFNCGHTPQTAPRPKRKTLALDGWIEEFRKLKKLNAEIMKTTKAKRAGK
jgi:hypothetical protein